MIEVNNTTRSKIDLLEMKKVAKYFLETSGIKKDLSVALISSQKMRNINKIYCGKDKTTDVLSFGGDGDCFGEILLDYQQIKKQAEKNGKSAQEELIFILVHGLLHLSGMNDDTEKNLAHILRKGEKFIKEYKYAKNKKII
jgi:probable rRNA maturation factor